MREYSIHGGEKGNERLAILSRTVGATTSGFLDRHQSSLSGHCLDLGCGGGAVTLAIARRLQDRGEAYGLDIDPVNIARARETARGQNVANARFDLSDAHDLADANRYQVIYSRFLLSHLKRPAEVL
ncbi:MAG: class I SAM-dependent methyltransferase, partial [Lewinella sp.]|nr:class I SAM-dependent methyltransferase [Lewinella sp.]